MADTDGMTHRRARLAIAAALLAACTADDGGTTTSLSGAPPTTSASDDDDDDDASSDSGTSTAGSETTAGSSSADGTTGTDSGATTSDVADSTSAGTTSEDADSSDSSDSTGDSETVGCADGEREGFVDLDAYPDIAGCSGGWDVPGVLNTTEPACDLGAGDDGPDPAGTGCTVADLCAAGWHVCATAGEVDDLSPNGCVGSVDGLGINLFFATRQSGPGQSTCGDGANDFHGCGNIGAGGVDPGCAPLDRTSDNLCEGLPPPWSCPGDVFMEANQVVKSGPANGGVLCCRDRL